MMQSHEEEPEDKNISAHIKFFNNNSSWNVGTTLKEVTQIDDVKFLDYTNLVKQSKEMFTISGLAYMINHLYGSSASLYCLSRCLAANNLSRRHHNVSTTPHVQLCDT